MDLAGKVLKLHIIRYWLNSYHKIVKIENYKILIWVLITVIIEKNHAHVEKVGTSQNFLLAFIDEL